MKKKEKLYYFEEYRIEDSNSIRGGEMYSKRHKTQTRYDNCCADTDNKGGRLESLTCVEFELTVTPSIS